MAVDRVLCPALVGRDSELSTLEDALLGAVRGDGGVVIVGGEAGMGKTRLVNALAMRAKRLGCHVVSGGCSEAELSLPYLPFLEAIGNYLASADVAQLRERLGPAAEELAQLFPQMGRPVPSGTDPTQAKLRLFESILLLLRDAARSRALLVILEDVQWADPTTRELLDYSTRRLRSTNVLVVATYRSDEMHRKHALLPTIQGWRRTGQAEVVELEPLDAPDVAEMMCAIFEESSVSDEFRDLLYERSEGNPFVIEEMLRDALDRGDIYRTETGWDRKALAEMRIPRTVRDTILQRLERLNREDVSVLSAASVMGRSFDLKSLAAVAGVDESSALSALETSVSAQLLEEDDRTSGRYHFRHALTREAIYEDLVVPRRQQLHSRVADVMAPREDRVAVDLANHLFNAGRNDEAVAMCAAAAGDAIHARAYRDAAELLERAAPFVRDSIERARMLCRAANCYWNNTEPANAKRLLEQGVTDLEAAGLSLEAAGHRLLLGRCFWELMRTDLALHEFEKARDVLEAVGPSEALAIAYIRLSGLAAFNVDLVVALDFARRAADIAKLANADLPRAWSRNFMALAEIGLGEVGTGFSHLDESYQGALAGGHGFQVGNAVYNSVSIAIDLALADEVARWSQRVRTMLQGETESWPPYIRALVALERGRVIEAVALARTATQRARDAGHGKMVYRTALVLAHALAENARADEATAVLPPLSDRVDLQDAASDTAARVRTRLAAGDLAGASADARTVSAQVCMLASPVDVIAEVAGDPEWLRSFIDALPVKGEVLQSPRLAAARGRLALLEGRLDDGLRELGGAVSAFEAGGFELDVWHVGRALAQAEFRSGDVERAHTRLVGIAAAAETAGARLAAKLARDEAKRLGIEIGDAAEPAPEVAIASRVAAGERMVSVLFADVRGYSEITGASTPADMADRISALQRWATQEVGRRHGVLDKFAGDAIMATFNVGGQSVDHTLQALRAAIAIIDKAALAGLPVGCGIAVGPAVVGNLAESANMSVLGEVTNLAARLQTQSGPGEVTLAEEAHRRVRDWLDGQRMVAARFEPALKGFGPSVVAYRVAVGMAAPAAI